MIERLDIKHNGISMDMFEALLLTKIKFSMTSLREGRANETLATN